jgi:hypothetical protein
MLDDALIQRHTPARSTKMQPAVEIIRNNQKRHIQQHVLSLVKGLEKYWRIRVWRHPSHPSLCMMALGQLTPINTLWNCRECPINVVLAIQWTPTHVWSEVDLMRLASTCGSILYDIRQDRCPSSQGLYECGISIPNGENGTDLPLHIGIEDLTVQLAQLNSYDHCPLCNKVHMRKEDETSEDDGMVVATSSCLPKWFQNIRKS